MVLSSMALLRQYIPPTAKWYLAPGRPNLDLLLILLGLYQGEPDLGGHGGEGEVLLHKINIGYWYSTIHPIVIPKLCNDVVRDVFILKNVYVVCFIFTPWGK